MLKPKRDMIGPKRSQNQLPIFMDDVTVRMPYTHFYTLGRSLQEQEITGI